LRHTVVLSCETDCIPPRWTPGTAGASRRFQLCPASTTTLHHAACKTAPQLRAASMLVVSYECEHWARLPAQLLTPCLSSSTRHAALPSPNERQKKEPHCIIPARQYKTIISRTWQKATGMAMTRVQACCSSRSIWTRTPSFMLIMHQMHLEQGYTNYVI